MIVPVVEVQGGITGGVYMEALFVDVEWKQIQGFSPLTE